MSRARSRCGAARIVGKPRALAVQSRLFVTGAKDRSVLLRKASRRSDFVTSAVTRDFWTCGPFADFVPGTALCDLEAQISWQAQHFVNLEVLIS